VRVRVALERIGDGEDSLARLAAEFGFADQAHLSRVVRCELQRTPSELRIDLQAAR
jgi:AraC-like DNA-binding protein